MSYTKHVFVFGSNLAGIHGAGSARAAAEKHGAKRGVGYGPTGDAFAIPTKRHWRSPAMPLEEIAPYVARFVGYAAANPSVAFDVVRIGCGLAGYTDEQIAPMFAGAPDNVKLPFGWREIIAGVLPSNDTL